MGVFLVDVQKASGGIAATILNVLAALMAFVAFLALLQGDKSFGVLAGVYILTGAIFLFAFGTIVGNLSKIVWILQRSEIVGLRSVSSTQTGSPADNVPIIPRGLVHGEMSQLEASAQAASVEEFNRGRT